MSLSEETYPPANMVLLFHLF